MFGKAVKKKICAGALSFDTFTVSQALKVFLHIATLRAPTVYGKSAPFRA